MEKNYLSLDNKISLPLVDLAARALHAKYVELPHDHTVILKSEAGHEIAKDIAAHVLEMNNISAEIKEYVKGGKAEHDKPAQAPGTDKLSGAALFASGVGSSLVAPNASPEFGR